MKVCKFIPTALTTCADITSMDNILVSNISSPSHSVLESMSGDKTASVLLPAAISSLARACVCRSSRLDGNLWRSPVSFDHTAAEAGGLPVRPSRYGRDEGSSCNTALQDLLALSGSAVRMGWYA